MNINDFSAVIFDLDGTIYYGAKLIEGSVKAVEFFKNKGIKVFFGTNNSSKTRETICNKLNNLGIKCCPEQILTSGYLAAIYCLNNKIKDIYICGSNELIEEFKNQGITINQEENATNLVIGFNKDATYQDLTSALRVALNAKNIVACNIERNYPGDYSLLYPSCGGMVKAIEWCANRECNYIVGKPNSFMIDYLRDKYGIDKKILVIGDSVEFDVGFAKNGYSTPVLIGGNSSLDCIQIDAIKDIPYLFE